MRGQRRQLIRKCKDGGKRTKNAPLGSDRHIHPCSAVTTAFNSLVLRNRLPQTRIRASQCCQEARSLLHLIPSLLTKLQRHKTGSPACSFPPLLPHRMLFFLLPFLPPALATMSLYLYVLPPCSRDLCFVGSTKLTGCYWEVPCKPAASKQDNLGSILPRGLLYANADNLVISGACRRDAWECAVIVSRSRKRAVITKWAPRGQIQ